MNRSIHLLAAAVLGFAISGSSAAQCVPGDVNGDGVVNGIDLSVVLLNWGQTCPAVIETVSPPSGLLAGGTTITITGSQLGGVQGVTIGGVPATSVVGVNSTTITAVTPPSKSQGPKDVVVTTTASSATLPGGFIYSPLAWALPLEFEPDPKVVTDPEWRDRIIATGLPWRVQDLGTGIEMLLVPPGTFMMGCSPSLQHPCEDDEYPVHEVTLTQPFYLGRYEVTQAQWTAVTGYNPSNFQQPSAEVPPSQVPNRPVDYVWEGSIAGFNAATGLRLPTEAEWEYACRGGTTTAFNNGSDDEATIDAIAWINTNSGGFGQTRPVGQKLPNALGFYDMHGNVSEYVQDWYSDAYYSESSGIDPAGPATGKRRVWRGGSWMYGADYCRVSNRSILVAGGEVLQAGIRAARTP